MFHTRLQFAVVRPSRQCGIYSTPGATGDPLQTVLYTGPPLRSILARQYPNTDEHLLIVLEVPGLPEVRLLPLLKHLLRGQTSGEHDCRVHMAAWEMRSALWGTVAR